MGLTRAAGRGGSNQGSWRGGFNQGSWRGWVLGLCGVICGGVEVVWGFSRGGTHV